MNKEVWGDPTNFRPERFLNEKNEIINTDKLVPFGQGTTIFRTAVYVQLLVIDISYDNIDNLLQGSEFAWGKYLQGPPFSRTLSVSFKTITFKNLHFTPLQRQSRFPASHWHLDHIMLSSRRGNDGGAVLISPKILTTYSGMSP